MTLQEALTYLHEIVDQVPEHPGKFSVTAKVYWRTILNIRILLAQHENKPDAYMRWRKIKKEWLTQFPDPTVESQDS